MKPSRLRRAPRRTLSRPFTSPHAHLAKGGASSAEKAINAAGPRIVAEGIRLEQAKALSSRELVLTYSLIALQVTEIEADLWEKIQPMIVQNVRRAEAQEARGLSNADITVNYRYVDNAGDPIVQIHIAPLSLGCVPDEPSDN